MRVKAHDDEGNGERVAGATVRAGETTVETDANGMATFTLPPGDHKLYAEKRGHVRSHTERVRVG